MISLLLGIAAFGLYLLYDINSYTRKLGFVHSFFLLGTVLLAIATALDVWAAVKAGAFSGWLDIVLLIGAAAFFVALIYSLFFALPFQETYTEQEGSGRVYSGGVYALCRHPGVLCFFAMYLFWGLAALPGNFLLCGMVFSLLNLSYAWFQDRVTFPKTFCDYPAYRETVPFLFPTPASFRRAAATWGHPDKKEEEKL